MKNSRLYILLILLTLMSIPAFAQTDGDYQTRTGASGNWTANNVWQKYITGSWSDVATYPTSADGLINVRSDAAILFDTAITVDGLTVNGVLTINTGISFAVNNGAGDDVTINGTFVHMGSVPNPMVGNGALNSGGIYVHNTTASAARMVDFFTIKDANSTWIYRGSSILNAAVSLAGKTFGNLEFESTSGSWSPATWAGATALTVNGNFKLGANVTLTMTTTGANVIKGNFLQNGAIVYSTGTQNFAFQGVGKTIGGTAGISFETASISSAGSYSLTTNINENTGFNFTVNGILNCGAYTVTGAGNFVVPSDGTLKIGSLTGINGNILVTGTKTFSTSGNYEFNGAGNQITGSLFPGTIKNLTINNAFVTALSNNLVVTGTINFINGYLELGNFNLGGTGSVTGDPDIIYNGTGIATGVGSSIDVIVMTLTPTSLPSVVDSLVVQTGPGNNFLLSNDITTTYLSFVSGGIILNHNVLTLANKDISFHAPDNTTFINALTVTKTNSPAAYGGGTQSISRLWNISGNSSAPVEITLDWPTPAADAGITFTGDVGRLWKYAGGGWTNMGAVSIFTDAGLRYVAFSYTLGAKDANNDFTVSGDMQTLPVELSSFTGAVINENQVMLRWVTESETNLSGFLVYRYSQNNIAQALLVSPLIAASNTSQQSIYSFVDQEATPGETWYYWLQNMDLDGHYAFHGPVSVTLASDGGENPEIPSLTAMGKVYPNPFNPQTSISYSLAKDSQVNIKVMNLKGQTVRSLVSDVRIKGEHTVSWNGVDDNGRSSASGMYYIVMQAGDFHTGRKVVLLK